jgi:hypothetical protein
MLQHVSRHRHISTLQGREETRKTLRSGAEFPALNLPSLLLASSSHYAVFYFETI